MPARMPKIPRTQEFPAVKRPRRMRRCLAMALIASLPSAGNAQSCQNEFGMQDVKALADAKRTDNSGPVSMLHPAIARLAANVAKSYACKNAINFYASKLGLPNDIVKGTREEARDALVIQFRNKVHSDQSVCGTIRYEVPLGLPGHDAETNVGDWLNWASRPFRPGVAGLAENSAYKDLLKWTHSAFTSTEGDISTEIEAMIQPYLPDGKNLPRPTDEYFRSIVHAFQRDLAGAFVDIVERHKWSSRDIGHFVRASGCTIILPTATGPDERTLAQYPSAFADYIQFQTEFEAGWQK